jgi:antitoxin MazE
MNSALAAGLFDVESPLMLFKPVPLTSWSEDVLALLTHLLDSGILWIRRKNLGGQVRTRVKKWGNSAAVRIPATVLHAAHLNLNDVVDVREKAGRIVIEPVRQKAYELRSLLDKITSKNQPESVDFGPPMGKEV